MKCKKHDLDVVSCSRQLSLFREEICQRCLTTSSQESVPSQESVTRLIFNVVAPQGGAGSHQRPWRRDRHGRAVERKVKATCSVCRQPVYGNVDPRKIITCGRCVQRFLTISREEKIREREVFLSSGDKEAARSVRSFIVQVEEEAISNGERKTKKFRRTVDRKGSVQKIRPQNRQDPFDGIRSLDGGGAEMY